MRGFASPKGAQRGNRPQACPAVQVQGQEAGLQGTLPSSAGAHARQPARSRREGSAVLGRLGTAALVPTQEVHAASVPRSQCERVRFFLFPTHFHGTKEKAPGSAGPTTRCFSRQRRLRPYLGGAGGRSLPVVTRHPGWTHPGLVHAGKRGTELHRENIERGTLRSLLLKIITVSKQTLCIPGIAVRSPPSVSFYLRTNPQNRCSPPTSKDRANQSVQRCSARLRADARGLRVLGTRSDPRPRSQCSAHRAPPLRAALPQAPVPLAGVFTVAHPHPLLPAETQVRTRVGACSEMRLP